MKTLWAALDVCADVRRFGSAAIDLAWIACGRADGYWETHLNPWDIAAGWLLVEEAGGCVTDFSGRKLTIEKSDQLLASNGLIHKKMAGSLFNS